MEIKILVQGAKVFINSTAWIRYGLIVKYYKREEKESNTGKVKYLTHKKTSYK